MSNPWKQFSDLLPGDPLLVGTVQAFNADGTSLVLLPDGGMIRAIGQTVPVGQKAFVRTGKVQGVAPALRYSEVTV